MGGGHIKNRHAMYINNKYKLDIKGTSYNDCCNTIKEISNAHDDNIINKCKADIVRECCDIRDRIKYITHLNRPELVNIINDLCLS